MYGLPAKADFTFLIGRELDQICFGFNQAILRFDGDTSISLECDYRLGRVENVSDPALLPRPTSDKLCGLLGFKITRAVPISQGDLALTFTDGSVLVIIDSNEGYESYEINSPTQIIVV